MVATSTDAASIRWAQAEGRTTIGMMLLWRFAFTAVGVMSYCACNKEKPRIDEGRILALTIPVSRGIDDGLLGAAFMLSLAANVAFLYALKPLWAAVGDCCFLGEELRTRTIGAIVGALIAVAIMFVPRMTGSNDTLLGDFLGLAAGIMHATTLCLNRAAAKHAPSLPLEFLNGMGAVVGAVGVAVVLLGTHLAFLPAANRSHFLAAMLCNAASATVPFIIYAVIARYTPASTIALVGMSVNSVLSPTWVHIIFRELPPTLVFVGGALLLVILLSHQLLAVNEAHALDRDIIHSEHDGRGDGTTRRKDCGVVDGGPTCDSKVPSDDDDDDDRDDV